MSPPLLLLARLVAERYYRLYVRSRLLVDPPLELHLTQRPSGWIEKPCWGDLSWVWRRHKVPAIGVGGFLCGQAGEAGCSALWQPDSPAYLAWCGAYVFRPRRFADFYRPGLGATRVARELGYRDDMTWSEMFGDRQPRYEEISVSRLAEPLAELPHVTESYFSTVRCHSYLGPRSWGFKARFASAVMAQLYRRSSGVELGPCFLCPTAELAAGHSYEEVLRDVWVLRVLFPDEGVIYAVYATSVRAVDGSWDHSKLLRPDFERFFRGVRLSER